MSETNKLSIFQKMHAITSELHSVSKTGKNPMGYKYLEFKILVNALKPLLEKYRVQINLVNSELLAVTEIKDKKTGNVSGLMTTIRNTYTFVDIDCQDEKSNYIKSAVIGQGYDSTDKGSNKANTSAFKYVLTKNFFVETDDDPENEKVPSKVSGGSSKSYNQDF